MIIIHSLPFSLACVHFVIKPGMPATSFIILPITCVYIFCAQFSVTVCSILCALFIKSSFLFQNSCVCVCLSCTSNKSFGVSSFVVSRGFRSYSAFRLLKFQPSPPRNSKIPLRNRKFRCSIESHS